MALKEGEAEIVEVWSDTFEDSFVSLEKAIEKYSTVAIDTEFGGMMDKSPAKNNFDLYAQMRSNVNKTKCIQVGFALSNEFGDTHESIWQFNLRFNKATDGYSPDVIEKLEDSGIEFEKHASTGIEGYKFGKALLRLLKSNPNITWVTFHGCYDFLHLVKLCLCGVYAQENPPDLPEDIADFYNMLCSFIGENTYDVKMLGAYNNPAYYGSLDNFVDELELERLGNSHQAGSDAYVTLLAYLNLKDSSTKDCRSLLFGLFHDFVDIY